MINKFFQKKFFKVYIFILFYFICFSFAGCSNLRQAIGTEKIVFDEFAVVQQKKLIIPPSFDLQSKTNETREIYSQKEIYDLFGVEVRNEFDNADQIFAQIFPFDEIVLDIRVIVDNETRELQLKANSGINILFNGNELPLIGELLDAENEQMRINSNK